MSDKNPRKPQLAEDMVERAFAHVRSEAKKRGGRVPDLSRQSSEFTRRRLPGGQVSKNESTLQAIMRIGRESGPDGRPIRSTRSYSAVGDVLQQEIRARGWAKNLAVGWVRGNWPRLVGDYIAQRSRVEKISDKKVVVSCESTAHATQMRTMQREILQRIAQQVGPNVITELRIFGPRGPSWKKGPLHVKGRGPRDTYG